jgi:hypothetical protein
MQRAHQARRSSKNPRQNEESRSVMPDETHELPRWESFPLEDRRQLVRAILQAARRQVEAGPASSPARR